jgi:hypothetical protein
MAVFVSDFAVERHQTIKSPTAARHQTVTLSEAFEACERSIGGMPVHIYVNTRFIVGLRVSIRVRDWCLICFNKAKRLRSGVAADLIQIWRGRHAKSNEAPMAGRTRPGPNGIRVTPCSDRSSRGYSCEIGWYSCYPGLFECRCKPNHVIRCSWGKS